MQGDLTTLANVKAWLNIQTANDDATISRLITATSQYIQSWLNRKFESVLQTEVRNGTGTAMLSLGDYPVTSVSSVTVNGQSILPVGSYGPAGYRFDSKMLYLYGYIFPMGNQNVEIVYTHGFLKENEPATVPTITFKVPVTSLSLPWGHDVAVKYSSSGIALTKVSGAPSVGEYSCDTTAGVTYYQFNASDVGLSMNISYGFIPQDIEQACIDLVALRYRERSRIGENSKAIGGEVVSYNVKDFPDHVKTILNNYRRVISFY